METTGSTTGEDGDMKKNEQLEDELDQMSVDSYMADFAAKTGITDDILNDWIARIAATGSLYPSETVCELLSLEQHYEPNRLKSHIETLIQQIERDR